MEGRNTAVPHTSGRRSTWPGVFQKAGLEPAGTNGYLQPVRFKTRTIVESGSSLALIRGDKREPLMLGEDANISLRSDAAATVDAPLVFIGYGLKVPELSFDDLAGQVLKGKIAVFLAGSPANIPGPLRAHYQSAGERWAALKARWRHWHDQHRQSQEHGHPVGALDARAPSAVDGARRCRRSMTTPASSWRSR